jgi:hypothetical protein
MRAWLNDLTTVYEQCAAERDALRRALCGLRLTIIRMRNSGHELPASLFQESEQWEQDAAERALASGLGVSEWPAFLSALRAERTAEETKP